MALSIVKPREEPFRLRGPGVVLQGGLPLVERLVEELDVPVDHGHPEPGGRPRRRGRGRPDLAAEAHQPVEIPDEAVGRIDPVEGDE